MPLQTEEFQGKKLSFLSCPSGCYVLSPAPFPKFWLFVSLAFRTPVE